ncbi:hypothetical protein [Ruegeria sp. HKCCD7318]|uniref:hypothetical protein n=1 Tax=Ruegeria sp. HKCCD7318 TaxID=2683014 RepID=UPI0014908D1D|nr:hypothetical protein [Ruegeria sp. HKCCD7318]NOE33873.1 hypothetical protein [Ruegeria sp. HKCCD7318]
MTIYNSTFDRRESDYYPTLDAPLIMPLLFDLIDLENVWEPSSGRGHLAIELKKRGKLLNASDLYDHPDKLCSISVGVDFLKQDVGPHGFRDIVMNPPYSEVDAHISHGLDLLPEKGYLVALLRSDWSHARCRQNLVTDERFFKEIKLTWRLRWIENTITSGKHNYSLFIWRRGVPTVPTIAFGYKLKGEAHARR